jgi:predicted acylesterase/phospholipase RssA
MADFDLVFEGGGAKGIAFVGALEVLKEKGHQTARYIGTSAGAITATLCAAGYSPQEMLTAILEKQDGKPRFTSFMDIPAAADFSPELRRNSLTMEALEDINLPLVPGRAEERIDEFLINNLVANRTYSRLFSFIECGGFYSGRTFLEWIREKLAVKGIAPDDTLGTFEQKTHADLSLCVTDTSDVELLVLNHRTAPDVPIANAVRMSMSIPFVWQEVIWQAEWGNYMGRAKTGNIIVDGGVLSNFPIRLIATIDDEIRQIMGDADPNAALNLGLLIDEELAVPGEANTSKTPLPVTHVRTIRRVSRLIDTMMGAADNEMLRRFSKEVCRLPAKGYGTLEFDMTGERLERFLQGGRDAMTAHLQSRGLDVITKVAKP